MTYSIYKIETSMLHCSKCRLGNIWARVSLWAELRLLMFWSCERISLTKQVDEFITTAGTNVLDHEMLYLISFF